MVIIPADESLSVASSCSFRTTPDSVAKPCSTPWIYWCGLGRQIGPTPKRTAIVTQNCALSRIRSREVVVVDEPCLPDPDGKHRQRARSAEGLRIDHLRIVDPGQRLGLDHLEQRGPQPGRIPLAAAV